MRYTERAYFTLRIYIQSVIGNIDATSRTVLEHRPGHAMIGPFGGALWDTGWAVERNRE